MMSNRKLTVKTIRMLITFCNVLLDKLMGYLIMLAFCMIHALEDLLI